MADPATNEANIQLLSSNFASFQAGTKAVESLTATERKTLENVLYPIINGFRARKTETSPDYTIWQIGDEVLNIDDSNKLLAIGRVIGVPFDPTADLQDRLKFDNYLETKPAIDI